MDHNALRTSLRQQRRSLSAHECESASKNAITLLTQHIKHTPFRRIGIYLPQHGELNPLWLTDHVHWQHRDFYLPIIGKRYTNTLRFGHANASLRLNRFNIPEPSTPHRHRLRASQLDLVLVPLVAFDRAGNRLGMGGGYYDRSFQFRRHRRHWHKPLMIGVAHHFQEVNHLPNQPWDVPLDAIVTDKQFIWT